MEALWSAEVGIFAWEQCWHLGSGGSVSMGNVSKHTEVIVSKYQTYYGLCLTEALS
jgi:hypothetical protein